MRPQTNYRYSENTKLGRPQENIPLYFRIRRDLSVTDTNCLLYDNRLVIPQKLKQLVLDTIHHKHPGQFGMLALAKLVW